MRFCPRCGSRLNPKGQRLLKREKCGITLDRDLVATLNLFKPGCGSPIPRTPPNKRGRNRRTPQDGYLNHLEERAEIRAL
ncbi:MAG: transposase [Euryarchaeota archaeon]|nr:transposase [Euryarchaeota archaeon]